MKKIGLLITLFALSICFSSVAAQDPFVMNIGSLKGPTTMGMVKMMADSEAGKTANTYNVQMYGTADEIVTGLVGKKLDAAAVPCNLASVLYNKTKGEVKAAAVNTLGVLYILDTGTSVQSIQDLKGKTIYSTGKGTTPEFALNYVLTQNGIDPEKDLTIEYKSEATEVAAMLADGTDMIAMLPQPYVTTVMMQNDKVRIALNLTEEWNKVSQSSTLVTGCVVIRKEFAEGNPEVVKTFMADYAASVEYVNANNQDAADLIAKYEIVPKAQVALKALPFCNIVFLTNDEMKSKLSGYLDVLYQANPASVGGNLPQDDFYLITEN